MNLYLCGDTLQGHETLKAGFGRADIWHGGRGLILSLSWLYTPTNMWMQWNHTMTWL